MNNDDWKAFAKDVEKKEIKELEESLEFLKKAITRISNQRERIRCRVVMRMRYTQQSLLAD